MSHTLSRTVASCDLAVAANEATFGVSGINVGLFCSTPAVALSRSVHKKHAMHMLLTGDLISAEQAVSYGLINKAVPLESLETETMSIAKKVASKSNYAIRLGKEVFYKQLQCNDLEDAYEFATERIASNFQHDDAKRGIGNKFRQQRVILPK
jgi:enoyl-CoA hydratase/carnithine racemase